MSPTQPMATDRRAEPGTVSVRIGSVTPSATLAIDARAKALRESGVDIVNFGAGEPNFPTPQAIVEAAVAACRDPKSHRYSPTAGLPELRAEIAKKTERDSHFSVEPSRVLVTNGAKHAVSNAFATLLDEGDEVLVASPYWTTYPEAIALAGGRTVVVPTDETSNFVADAARLERFATERTKVILLVSPSNPTGAVYSRDQIADVGQLALERNWWVITDEIYEHLVYDEAEHHSLPAVVPEIAERCLVVNGVSKTYAMTGWRVGWLIGPTEVIDAATNLQSHVTSNVSNVAQLAALSALRGDLSSAREMHAAFDRRRKVIHKLLNEIPGVRSVLPNGAFYAFPNMSGLLGRSFGNRRPVSTLELAELALEEAHVAFVPGEAFGAPGYARFSYALADDDLEEGLRRLEALVRSSTD
ncbi:MAG TPA: pyridoxal phosphate-dependent aminotransferase [Acidimicrobiales bacterium]|nr:pyridoxal phosphate-dependent aminotransferase [Acidimicrobiales bacterium]